MRPAARESHVVAAKAKVTKPVTTHAIRKAVGTIIGKTNPKFAKLQLGITDKIFERHYNQPLLEDRLERRDLLPGADWKPRTPEEVAGAALLAYSAGKLTRDQFEDAVAKARDLTATTTKKNVDEPSGYV